MNFWQEAEHLIHINHYLLVLFIISVALWGLFLNQLILIINLKCSRQPNYKLTLNKPWLHFWFNQTHQSMVIYQLHKSLSLMKALIVSMPMVGLAGTVMMLTAGFKSMGNTGTVNIHAFSDIVTGAMATTFTGVFLSVIGMLLFKILNIVIHKKHLEAPL
ncbi:hypothetical protein JCM30760_01280 [Thiomicrorhabdus hydrogeniphila]